MKIYAMSGLKKKINSKLSGLFLIAIIFLRPLPAEADVILQNQLEVPMSVCSNDGSEPIALRPNGAISIQKPPGLLSFWFCKAGNGKCINAQDPIATMAVLSISDDSISYWLSAELGYNFALRIMCFGCPSCETITCKANLDNCPHELQIRDPNPSGAVVACKPPPERTEPDSQLRFAYSSLFADSHCQMPSSWDDPSSDSKTCLDSRDLLVSIIDS